MRNPLASKISRHSSTTDATGTAIGSRNPGFIHLPKRGFSWRNSAISSDRVKSIGRQTPMNAAVFFMAMRNASLAQMLRKFASPVNRVPVVLQKALRKTSA